MHFIYSCLKYISDMMDKVVHFEIPADDIERAQKFYKTVFKWEINPMPEMNYTMVRTVKIDEKSMIPKEPGAINGGMMKRSKDVTAPVITIGVSDIEKAGKDVEQNGGKVIVPKMKVGDMGWAAYIKDTEGNILGLWQNVRSS